MNNALKWGGLLGAACIILSLATYMLGMSEPGGSNWVGSLLNYAVNIPILVLGVKAFKAANDNYLTVGNGISQGVLMGLIAGLIMAIYSYIFFTYIDPSFLETMKEAALDQQGAMSAEQEEMTSSWMNMFMSPGSMAIMTVIMKVCLGFIIGLIAGAVMKNVRPYDSGTL